MKPINGASTDASEAATKRNRYACLAAVAIAIFFVVSLSGGGAAGTDSKVRTGQASQHIDKSPGGSKVSTGEVDSGKKDNKKGKQDEGQDEGGIGGEEEDEFEKGDKKLVKAEDDELAEMDPKLVKQLEFRNTWMRDQIQNLLKDDKDFDEDDITALGNLCEDRLNEKIKGEISDEAEEAKQEEEKELEMDLDINEEDNGGTETIDIEEEETKLVVDLKDKIHDIVLKAEDELKEMGALVVKEIVEDKLLDVKGERWVVEVNEVFDIIGYHPRKSSGEKKVAKSTKATTTPPTDAATTTKKKTKTGARRK